MDIELKEDYVVEFEDVDFLGNINFLGLAKNMQNIAIHHADLIGVGFYKDELKPTYYWVVSRVKYILNKTIQWKEKVSLNTWLAGSQKFFVIRKTDIMRESNEIIGQIIMNYMLLDADKGRPLRITDNIGNGTMVREYEGEILPKLGIPTNIVAEEIRKARYSDLDVNGHMNNVQYVKWILDMLPLDFYREREVESLQINYNKPVMYQDKIKVILGTVKEAGYRVAGVSLDNKINYFTAHMTFRE
ncbi:acyl-[acyl-carrier-protein] thioesterase [Cellulosilyticum ruminicola]|uniref:acyl-[acyl-carrier-protein] thioesterase n=1 Tax=Cellulosilyticum ruminicola TaxID=425254 RepID=UPI0006D1D00D|nr:acyl-ACP thioesterase domain-containing protein [Cellulosilyticum ruminicola]